MHCWGDRADCGERERTNPQGAIRLGEPTKQNGAERRARPGDSRQAKRCPIMGGGGGRSLDVIGWFVVRECEIDSKSRPQQNHRTRQRSAHCRLGVKGPQRGGCPAAANRSNYRRFARSRECWRKWHGAHTRNWQVVSLGYLGVRLNDSLRFSASRLLPVVRNHNRGLGRSCSSLRKCQFPPRIDRVPKKPGLP